MKKNSTFLDFQHIITINKIINDSVDSIEKGKIDMSIISNNITNINGGNTSGTVVYVNNTGNTTT